MRHSDAERPDSSLLDQMLRSLTRFVARRPKSTLIAILLFSSAAVAFSVCRLSFKTDRADLIDPRAEFHQRWLEYVDGFGDGADLVIVVESESPSVVRQALDDIGRRMIREPDLFSNVLYRVEPGKLRAKGLHYLNSRQLEAGLDRLAEYRPILQGRWDLVGLESLFTRFQYQYDARMANPAAEDLRPLMEHAERLSTSLARTLSGPANFTNPWPEIVPVDPRLRSEGNQPIYFLNEQGTMGFLKALPTKRAGDFSGNSKSIDRARAIIAEVAPHYPTGRIGLTGIPVLESDEMRASQADMLVASILSTIGVALILLVGFRGYRHPMLAMVMLAAGMAWSFGFTTLAVGHLNILSVSFAVMLIGLGADFSIHYLSKYLDLRRQGRQLRPALLETSTKIGPGILTAAMTTAAAFFCATMTEFLGVAELGIIAGGGILLCALAAFVVLPPLVALADAGVESKQLPTPFQWNWLRNTTARWPLVVVVVSGVLVLGTTFMGFTVRDGRPSARFQYDYNLLNLQAAGLESVDLQKRIADQSKDRLLYAVSVADSPDEARALRMKFEALPTVSHVEELASHLPSNTPQQTKLLVQAYRAELSRLPARAPQLYSPNPAAVGRAMEDFYLRIRRSRDPVAMNAAKAINFFLNHFEKMPAREQTAFLTEFQFRTTASLLAQFQALAAAANPRPVSLEDLPPELTSRFVSPDGKWLVQVFPKDSIWDVEPLERFVNDVRQVDPDVTGAPLQNYEASRQILGSYQTAAIYAFGVICIVLLLDFLDGRNKVLVLGLPLVIAVFTVVALISRRASVNPALVVGTYLAVAAALTAIVDVRSLRSAGLAMLPPLAGGLMMFGIMGICGVDLNPANLIVLPLILGLGVDYGVHVLHDFRQQEGEYRTSGSMINSIILTSLTTMVGFGSMMIASHRGLFSVGLVMVIGMACTLFVSLMVLPAILTLISRRQGGAAASAEPATHKLEPRQAKGQPQQHQHQQRRAA